MSDEKGIIDWAALVAALTVDEDRARSRQREAYVQHIDQWWYRVLPELPQIEFARWSNSEWVRKCHPEVVSRVKRWQPIRRIGANAVEAHGLLLSARTGIGKSTAVLAQLHDTARRMRKATQDGTLAIKYPPTIAWYTEEQLVASSRSLKDREAFDRACRVSLLVMDEVGYAGGESAPRGSSPVVMAVMCHRYDAGLPTIITTGLRTQELGAKYGAACLRRMMTRAELIEVHDGAK